jgi:hypothetical protein
MSHLAALLDAFDGTLWVRQGQNIGRLIGTGVSGEVNFVGIKWLSRDVPFHKQVVTYIAGDSKDAMESFEIIPEPKLSAEEAACYTDRTRSRIYQWNNSGYFGERRNPFFVLPSELDRRLQEIEQRQTKVATGGD